MDNQEAKGRQLLSQLERVSRSAGLLAVSYKPQQPVPTPLDVDPDLPPSVALYPVRSLAQQAEDAHCEEMETNTEIKELCRHDDRDAAHACLNADYSHFKSHRTPEDFRRLDLAPKLIALRTAQARARDAEEKSFSVDTVTGVCPYTGRATSQLRYYLSLDISWAGFLSALKDMAMGAAARAAGCPYGYTLEHGKWLYQLQDIGSSTPYHDLACDLDYDNMRKAMRQSPAGKLLIWHERLLASSKKARERLASPEGLAFNSWETTSEKSASLEDFDFDLSDTDSEDGWRAFDKMVARGEDASAIKFDSLMTEEEFLQLQHEALLGTRVEKKARKRKAAEGDQDGQATKKTRPQSGEEDARGEPRCA